MRELQSCLTLKRKIEDVNGKINALRAVIYSPKNQFITGMPKASGGMDNAIDKYLVKLERLEKRKKDLKGKQINLWKYVRQEATKAELSEQEIKLLYHRFVKGLPWKKVCRALNDAYGNWNINKVFRTYRNVLIRLPKESNKTA